jgi:hypothetical protein
VPRPLSETDGSISCWIVIFTATIILVGMGTWSLHLWDKIKKEGKKKEDGVLVKILKKRS